MPLKLKLDAGSYCRSKSIPSAATGLRLSDMLTTATVEDGRLGPSRTPLEHAAFLA